MSTTYQPEPVRVRQIGDLYNVEIQTAKHGWIPQCEWLTLGEACNDAADWNPVFTVMTSALHKG